MIRRAGLGFVALLVIAAGPAPSRPERMDWPDLLARPAPRATERIHYGTRPDQFGDLWLPDGTGPFPIVLMIHGGCWISRVASLTVMNYVAADLRRRGIAVWNIEYRGIDRPGGGYPGTFLDVAAAADALRGVAARHPLDLDRVVAVGHSAGGHLALWLAARDWLPPDSPLAGGTPLPIAAVVTLGGLPDLEAAYRRGALACGADTVADLVGRPGPGRPDVYADTSPAALGVGPRPIVLVSGAEDRIAPPNVAHDFAERTRGFSGAVTEIVVPETGHVELVSPDTEAWAAAATAIGDLLHR